MTTGRSIVMGKISGMEEKSPGIVLLWPKSSFEVCGTIFLKIIF